MKYVVVTFASETCGDVPVAVLSGVTAAQVNRELDEAGIDDLCAEESTFIDLTQNPERPVDLLKRLVQKFKEDRSDH